MIAAAGGVRGSGYVRRMTDPSSPVRFVDVWPSHLEGFVWVRVSETGAGFFDALRKPVRAAKLDVVLDSVAPGAEVAVGDDVALRTALKGAKPVRVVKQHTDVRCHNPGLSHDECACTPVVCLDPPPPARDGEVYFVQAATGQIKIGHSGYALSRLECLQTGSPVRLRLLAVTPGSMVLEHELHRRFASARLHGEWFRPVPELLTFIKEIALAQAG